MAKNRKTLLIVSAIVLLLAIALICFFVFKDEEKATYKVTFDSNGGSIISEQVVEEGNSAKKPVDPTKDGYIFTEWLLNGESYDFNNIVKKNITLKADWTENVSEKELVTIKFNSDGGTTIANAIVEKGSKVGQPTIPTKEGYTFVEWQLSNSKYDFELEVTEDLELVAIWEKNKTTDNQNTNKPGNNNSGDNNPGTTTPTTKKYTITFNSNGGSSVASQTVEQGKKATQPSNPTRSGYTFAGWTLNGSTYNFSSVVNGNITLVAKWTENSKNKYTVTFNSNGGSSVASQTVEQGKKATQPSNPTRSGYTFAGWTLNGSIYNFSSVVNGDITLVAKWTQKNYTISVTKVDDYSPDRILTVYENGSKINVNSIKYSDGVLLCNGNNTTVMFSDIEGESSFIVVLSDGKEVTATLKN